MFKNHDRGLNHILYWFVKVRNRAYMESCQIILKVKLKNCKHF